MPLLPREVLMNDACCCYPVSQEIVQQHQRAYEWTTGEVRGGYTWPLPVISLVSLQTNICSVSGQIAGFEALIVTGSYIVLQHLFTLTMSLRRNLRLWPGEILLLPQSAGCRSVSGTARVILLEEEVMKLIIACCSHTHQSKAQLLLRTASDVSRSVTICTWLLYKLVEQLESSLAY